MKGWSFFKKSAKSYKEKETGNNIEKEKNLVKNIERKQKKVY